VGKVIIIFCLNLAQISLVLLWSNDVVDLQDHLDHLCGKLELLLLGHY